LKFSSQRSLKKLAKPTELHESLTAKQLLIYATPFGKLTNESEEGGLIPAELMEQMLLDKSSIKPPFFHPSKEQSSIYLEEFKEDLQTSKGKKEDPAAAARKAQLVQEAEVRLDLVLLRDEISKLLFAIKYFSRGARNIVCERLTEVSRPCLLFLSSPLVGESAALECLNSIIACIPGIIGRHHTILSACFHLIRKEEAKSCPNFDVIAASPFLADGADVILQATVRAYPRKQLSSQQYAFLFPIAKSILRSRVPTNFHQSLLELIELHVDMSIKELSMDEEFALLFHVLEIVPALKLKTQELLTKLCSVTEHCDRVFAAAVRGVLLSQASSRLAALTAMHNSSGELFNAQIDDCSRGLLWIARNDVVEDVAAIGTSLWERCSSRASVGMIDQIVSYCSFDALEVRKSSCKSLGTLTALLKESEAAVVGDTLSKVTHGLYSRNASLSQRLGAADCLRELANSLSGDDIVKSLEFMLSDGFLDPDSEVRSSMMAAGVAVMGAASAEMAERILPIMEKYLEKPHGKWSFRRAI
jgi:hypothetical protein